MVQKNGHFMVFDHTPLTTHPQASTDQKNCLRMAKRRKTAWLREVLKNLLKISFQQNFEFSKSVERLKS